MRRTGLAIASGYHRYYGRRRTAWLVGDSTTCGASCSSGSGSISGSGRFPHDAQRRFLLSPAVEPPVNNPNVPERPCTLVLAQDIGVIHGVRSLSDGSWHDDFQTKVPTAFGMAYRQWQLSERRVLESSFDGALTELKDDLGTAQNVVLVTRGPWMSWMAQFYLESLPLAGLVMVDPLPFNNDDACFLFQRQYKQHYYPGNDRPVPDFTLSREYALFTDYTTHYNHWTLKLEPGAVPMMILATSNVVWEQDQSEKMLQMQLEFSHQVATRHSQSTTRAATTPTTRATTATIPKASGRRKNRPLILQQQAARIDESTATRQVPVVPIDSSNRDACVETICRWIEDHVL